MRAVGAAVGRNPVSIFVPCHRVIGRDGSLTGYAGGLERKEHLLALEGMLPVASLTLPGMLMPLATPETR
jgi:methylated-DNA-[protein]-cysteine S-methyltransferase